MTDTVSDKIVIHGVTLSGEVFRPSDWAERMCGNLCTFRNRRVYYSPLLQPAIIDGQRCVVVDPALASQHPKLHAEVMAFAEHNLLRTGPYEES